MAVELNHDDLGSLASKCLNPGEDLKIIVEGVKFMPEREREREKVEQQF